MDVDADRADAAARSRPVSAALSPRSHRAYGAARGVALYAADGVVGVVTHIRGVMRKPGGFREPIYNIVMGPPLLAPGSLVPGGSGGPARRIIAPGALAMAFEDAGHLPNNRDGQPAEPVACPANGVGDAADARSLSRL